MSEPRKHNRSSAAASILIAVVVAGVLGAYVAGYFALSTHGYSSVPGRSSYRIYESEWQATVFRPAASVESAVRRRDVRVIVSPKFQEK